MVCASSWPGSRLITQARGEIKRVFAHGDYVILHSHWHGLSDNAAGEAVVDIFRLESGKVVEHWDVIQPVPETSANATRCSEFSREFRCSGRATPLVAPTDPKVSKTPSSNRFFHDALRTTQIRLIVYTQRS
jgi:hypothetical protein